MQPTVSNTPTPYVQETISVYSPSSIVSIIQNVYVTPAEKKLIALRGVYKAKGKVNYSGLYYDELKDEASQHTLTLIVPELIRNRLTDNKTIEIICYITKKPETNGSIKIQANVTDLLTQTHNKFSEEEIKALEIQQKKSEMGLRDVDGFIKKSIYDGYKPKMKIIVAKDGVAKDDMEGQMGEAIGLYDITFVRTSITSASQIIEALKQCDTEGTDIIVVARGGGKEIETFDDLGLAEACLSLRAFFVTALGHKPNTPLVERIADRHFITPTAFGQYLKETYNETVQSREESLAKAVDSVKKQMQANHDGQLKVLRDKIQQDSDLHIKTLNETKTLHSTEVKLLNERLGKLQEQFGQQIKEKDQLVLEKEKLMNDKLQNAIKESEQKQNLLSESQKFSQQLKTNYDSLRGEIESVRSSNTRNAIIAVVVGAIIGLVIGLALH